MEMTTIARNGDFAVMKDQHGGYHVCGGDPFEWLLDTRSKLKALMMLSVLVMSDNPDLVDP